MLSLELLVVLDFVNTSSVFGGCVVLFSQGSFLVESVFVEDNKFMILSLSPK